jgi:hypothetical protein
MVHQCVIKSVVMWLHILVVSLLMCLTDVTYFCGPNKNISSTFFQYGTQKPKINSNILN